MVQPILVSGRLADQGAGYVVEDAEDEIELDKGEPQGLALQGALYVAFGRGLVGRGGIAIDAHLVAVLAAQKLVAGHAVGLAGQVPEGKLDAGHAAALATGAAIAFDRAEEHIDVAGVLAQEKALELEGVLLVAGVSDLADAIDILVRVDADHRVIIV